MDRISALPDDLIVSIVSLLPLKEAAATSVLSTRWHHIWTFVTTLDFQHDILFQLRSYKKVRIDLELDRYLNWVNSVMKQHRGPTIKMLRVYADIKDPKYLCFIHTCVRFALEKRVQNFDLLLSKNRVFPKRGGNEIKAIFRAFPSSDQLVDVDSSVFGLCFEPDILHPCVYSCFGAFSCLKNLKVLEFKSVAGLTGKVLECFLSNCPVLERLTVVRPLRLDSFKVIGPSIALKYLHIHKNMGPMSIEICDVNLVSFIYGGDVINLLLRNVPQLVEVSISSHRLSFRDCNSQLKVLRLRGYVLNNDKHIIPTYVNLKHLEVGLKERDSFCVLQLASFMRASPYLHKLVLKLARTISRYYEILMEPHRYHERQVEIKQAAKYSHRFLTVVEVVEYHGRISDFELVRYLIENAVELQELVIHPVRTWYSREHIRFNMGNNKEEVLMKEKWKRKQAIQQVKELVGASHVAQPEEGLFQDAQNLVVMDRISALPNDLLVSILSLLPLKEAATTSVLSTRWRQIWTFVTTLDFQHDSLFQLRSYKRVRIESELDRYLNWVNTVMKQHRGSTVKLLRVYADIKDPKYVSSIHSWGRFALEKRVQNLHIVLSKNRVFPKRGGNEIKAVCSATPCSNQLLTVDTGSGLNHLCFEPGILPCLYLDCFREFSVLKYLRDLDFRSVTGLTGQVLECFLSHCPLLERLTVVRALQLDTFRVIGRSIALKYLHIQKHTGLLSIEISDANLVSFCYGGDEIDLLLRNVPQLIEVSISSHRLSFGDCVSQLEFLRLRGFELNNEKHVFPTYANLKHLELGLKERDSFCVLQLASFMRASPCLQSLVLKLARTISRNYEILMEPYRYHERQVEIKQAAKYSHRFLTVVEVAEYHGRVSDFELVKYLIENAVELKQLVIHPVRQWYSREHIRFNMGNNKEGAKKTEKWKRKRAALMLKELVPSTVEFICRLEHSYAGWSNRFQLRPNPHWLCGQWD